MEKTRAAHQKNGVRQLVQHEVGCRKLCCSSFLCKSKSKRGAEVAGEALGLIQIGGSKSPRDLSPKATRTAEASVSNKAGAAITL